MLGTETYAPGGAVSGGSDSYTWIQSASDVATIIEVGDAGTLGGAPEYEISVADYIGNEISDVGTDILGSSDTILGGCDTYSIIELRALYSTVDDYGVVGTPYYLQGYAWDTDYLTDTGSSTLTTNGHVYATDTFGYDENTGDTRPLNRNRETTCSSPAPRTTTTSTPSVVRSPFRTRRRPRSTLSPKPIRTGSVPIMPARPVIRPLRRTGLTTAPTTTS